MDNVKVLREPEAWHLRTFASYAGTGLAFLIGEDGGAPSVLITLTARQALQLAETLGRARDDLAREHDAGRGGNPFKAISFVRE